MLSIKYAEIFKIETSEWLNLVSYFQILSYWKGKSQIMNAIPAQFSSGQGSL